MYCVGWEFYKNDYICVYVVEYYTLGLFTTLLHVV